MVGNCVTHPTEPYPVLRPNRPKPIAVISGPFLPSLRVGSLMGGAMLFLQTGTLQKLNGFTV